MLYCTEMLDYNDVRNVFVNHQYWMFVIGSSEQNVATSCKCMHASDVSWNFFKELIPRVSWNTL